VLHSILCIIQKNIYTDKDKTEEPLFCLKGEITFAWEKKMEFTSQIIELLKVAIIVTFLVAKITYRYQML